MMTRGHDSKPYSAPAVGGEDEAAKAARRATYVRSVEYGLDTPAEIGPPGNVKTFMFKTPHTMLLEALCFAGDYDILAIYVGAEGVLGDTARHLFTRDCPRGVINLQRDLFPGMSVTVTATAAAPTLFRASVKGRRAAARPRRTADVQPQAAMHGPLYDLGSYSIGGVLLRPNQTETFTHYGSYHFRGDRFVADNPERFQLIAAEVGRDSQIDAPMSLTETAKALLLNAAGPCEELRFTVKNVSDEAAMFHGRLYGLLLP